MNSPRVLVAMPVYNEAKHITPVLKQVRRYATDILVVDDGSSDDTPEILRSERGIRVVRHEQNQGYGAALRTAFHYATDEGFDVVITIDCDGQHEPKLIPVLADVLWNGGGEKPYDFVSGSRYLREFDGDSTPPEERREINVKITCILNEHLGLGLTDAFCGFKAYRVSSLGHFDITELGYALPLEMWAQAAAAKMNIVEFPVPLIYLDEKRSFGGALDDGKRRYRYYLKVFNRELERQGLLTLNLDNVPCGG
ncbi:glycosyltransferase family 2 protein [Calycomorphotria hydatis]|nr:glycosyltransferase family 2 protein [Calycomorphotria hydatis]